MLFSLGGKKNALHKTELVWKVIAKGLRTKHKKRFTLERGQKHTIKISLGSTHYRSFRLSTRMAECIKKPGTGCWRQKGQNPQPFVTAEIHLSNLHCGLCLLYLRVFQRSAAYCYGLTEQGPHDLTCWAFSPQLLLLCEGCRILRPGASLEKGPWRSSPGPSSSSFCDYLRPVPAKKYPRKWF